jgi:hypothetical protein
MKSNHRYESRIIKNAARQLARFLVCSKGLPSGWADKSMSIGVRKHLSFMYRRRHLNNWKLDTVDKRVIVEAQKIILTKIKKHTKRNTPNTKTTELAVGLSGPLATSFYHEEGGYSFDAIGLVHIERATMGIPSPGPISFDICARHTDGTVRLVSSGTIPARVKTANQSALGLTYHEVLNTDPNTRYFFRPAGGMVQSKINPHFYLIHQALRGSVGGACELAVVMTMRVNGSRFLTRAAQSSALMYGDEPSLSKAWIDRLMKNM